MQMLIASESILAIPTPRFEAFCSPPPHPSEGVPGYEFRHDHSLSKAYKEKMMRSTACEAFLVGQCR